MEAAVIAYIARNRQVTEAGEYLTYIAEVAYRLRRWPEVGKAAELLTLLPSQTYQSRGRFYQAYWVSNASSHTSEEAVKMMEEIANAGPADFIARSLVALGSFHFERKEFQTAMEFYQQAVMAATRAGDAVNLAGALKMLGVLESIHGEPAAALRLYEAALAGGLIQRFRPDAYLDIANSYAFDLAAVGRVEEAYEIARRLTGSPWAQVFTTVNETLAEIEAQLPVRRLVSLSATSPRLFASALRLPADEGRRLGRNFRLAPALPTVEEMHNLLLAWMVANEPKLITGMTYPKLVDMYGVYLRQDSK